MKLLSHLFITSLTICCWYQVIYGGASDSSDLRTRDPTADRNSGLSSKYHSYDRESSLLTSIITESTKGNINVSSACQVSLKRLRQDLSTGQEYAIKVVESFRSTAPDIRSGHLANFGDYDSCLGIHSSDSDEETSFSGKYCLYQEHYKKLPPLDQEEMKTDVFWSSKPKDFYKFLSFESMTGSICFPSSCQDEEIKSILNTFFTSSSTNDRTFIELRTGECESRQSIIKSSEEKSHVQKAALKILMTWIFILISAELIKFRPQMIESKMVQKVCSCFSLKENTERLFTDDLSDNFKFIYGYRMLFMIGSTVFHVFMMPIFWSPLSLINIFTYNGTTATSFWFPREFASNVSAGMPLAFLMSGFLGFHSRFREMQTIRGRLELLKYLLKSLVTRALRTLPAVFGCYLLILSFSPLFFGASGPLLKSSFDQIYGNCINNWSYEFFLQNILHPSQMCIMPSWILAPDLYLYMMSFGLVYLYLTNRRWGLTVATLLVGVGILAEAFYINYWDLPPYMDLASYDYRDLNDRQTGLHTYTVNYVAPYLIGLICAIRVLEKKFPRSKLFFYFMVWFSVSLYGAIYYIPSTWRSRDNVMRIEKIVFGSFSRSMVAFPIATSFFYQSVVKPNAIAAKINGNKLFVILGRFSFASYLGHFMVMYYDVFTTKSPLEFTSYNMVMRPTYVLMYGHVLGYFIHVVFEAPFIRLSKVIFPKRSEKVSRPSDIANNNQVIDNNHPRDTIRQTATNGSVKKFE